MINKNFNSIGRFSYSIFFKQYLNKNFNNNDINKRFFTNDEKKPTDNIDQKENNFESNTDKPVAASENEDGEFMWGKLFSSVHRSNMMLARQTKRTFMGQDELLKDNERLGAIARVKDERWERNPELKEEDEKELEQRGFITKNFTLMIDKYNKNIHEAENKKREQLEEKGLSLNEKRDLRLQDQKYYLQEHLESHINPFGYARWRQKYDHIDTHFLTIEGRIINESEDSRQEDPEWYEHEFNPEHDTAFSTSDALIPKTIHQAMFLTYFEDRRIAKGDLPEGYAYFHDSQMFREVVENEAKYLEATGGDPTNTSGSIMYSIYYSGLRESQLGLPKEEMEKAADFKASGYFDSTMVVKSPQNLGLLYNKEFYEHYYVSDEEKQTLLDNEATLVEALVFSRGTNVIGTTNEPGAEEKIYSVENPALQHYDQGFARARPINKHAAYFRKVAGINDTEMYIEHFIYFHMKYLEKNVDDPGYFGKFIENFGYDREYRLKKLNDFRARCKRRWDRVEELWKLAYQNGGKVPLIDGEIPTPPEIPLEYFQIEPAERSVFGFKITITKPAYFERRAEKFPGRYDNTWYDQELINFLEPPYTNYEHAGFIALELMERVHAFFLSRHDINSPDHLPLKGIPDYGWRDPSIAEIVESDFAILPGTKLDDFFSFYYARWDDPRVISDYEGASILYDDCLRMIYPKSVWYESYPQYVKIMLGVIDILLFTFFFLEGVIHTDFYCFFIYIFFANVTEWVRW